MEILAEIREAINDYYRMNRITPDTIYIARGTYEKFLQDVKDQLVEVKISTPQEYPGASLFGLRIKITRAIKDGFVVVNEFV